jgi:hypothetical protein
MQHRYAPCIQFSTDVASCRELFVEVRVIFEGQTSFILKTFFAAYGRLALNLGHPSFSKDCGDSAHYHVPCCHHHMLR